VTVSRKPDQPARKSADIAARKSNDLATVRRSNDQLPMVKISKSNEHVQKVNDSTGKDTQPAEKKTPTVSLEDMVNVRIISPARDSPVSLGLLPTLSTYSTKLCHRCVQSIPEGVPSILFHNRTYHSKCYYCSHCRVSLFEHRAFHHQNDLYCADCHFVINIEFTPPKK
jgi:hypothetical protein